MASSQIKTREDLFDLYREKFVIKKSPLFIKSVPVQSNDDFREAVAVCLQELLGIEQVENLTPFEIVEFSKEVEYWYKYVPKYYNKRPVNRNYKSFKINNSEFLSRELYLGNSDDVPSQVVPLINFNHVTNKGSVSIFNFLVV